MGFAASHSLGDPLLKPLNPKSCVSKVLKPPTLLQDTGPNPAGFLPTHAEKVQMLLSISAS